MIIKNNRRKNMNMGKLQKINEIVQHEPDELDFFQSVAELIQKARRELERQVNTTMVITYFEVGRRIIEKEQQGAKRAQYGKRILQGLSDYLTANQGKGYSVENLRLMRRFYDVYSASIPLNTDISWSQYVLLTRIKNPDERRFYEIEIVENRWMFREFERQYDSALYERLALSRNKKKVRELAAKGHIVEEPQDIFKDPYVLEFAGLPEKTEYTETQLEQKLIDHLQHFLLELGKGFSFVGRQVRFTYEEESFYVDLVFYNRLLKSFVVMDLKIGKLRHQDIGQMQMYVNFYDRKVKLPDENPTIGIILCRDKKDAMVEMMLPKESKRIFAAKYETVLPSKTDLKKLLEAND